MKKPIIAILLSFIIVNAFAQPDQRGLIDSALVPKPYLHYQKEYDFDKSIDPGKWEKQKNLHVSFASSDEAYFRAEVPGINETKTWTATDGKENV